MSPLENGRIFIDTDASTLAFRVGQLVEKLLMDRGLKLARAAQTSVITADDIESSIDDSLLEDLKKHLNEPAEQESREAA
jgi:hypothetical protein